MWSSIILLMFLTKICAGNNVFRKCCPKNHSLVKVTGSKDSEILNYICIDSVLETSDYSVTNFASHLIVKTSFEVEYDIPSENDDCKIEIIQVNVIGVSQSSDQNICYDRLVLEIINGTINNITPKTVVLKCNNTEIELERNLRVQSVRKCCPKGQVYDNVYHVCRIEEKANEEWLITHFKHDMADVYEFDNGLYCKQDEYAVELKAGLNFDFALEDSTLILSDKTKETVEPILKGNWCVDQEYSTRELVARVCTRNCKAFGALCIRKCCPVGEHYTPHICGRPASKCVSNKDDQVLFNISSHIDPLKMKYGVDLLGIRSEIKCKSGKIALNTSLPSDWHYLTIDGRLNSLLSLTNDYCLETFDTRSCGEEPYVTAVMCFVKPPVNKNFKLSFVLNCLSAICLALTLVVYCSLSELRNLHGLNLICHVSTMLLAYSCLARVQHKIVEDKNFCAILGYAIYFGFVAALAWLNVMCLDIWWTFGSVRTVQPLHKSSAKRRRFLWYSLYAWGNSISLTLVMYLFDRYPVSTILDANMGDGRCWFGSAQNTASDWPHYIFFVIPMGLVSGVNFVLWVLTARHCVRVKSEVHRLQAGSVGDRAKRRFRVDKANLVLTGKLWVVMGAGWISELVSTLIEKPDLGMPWIFTPIDMVNELQGVFIFIILVFKPKLYYLFRKRLGCSRTSNIPSLEKTGAQKNGASSSARTSSTFFSRTISTDERSNKRVSAPSEIAKLQ